MSQRHRSSDLHADFNRMALLLDDPDEPVTPTQEKAARTWFDPRAIPDPDGR